MIELYGTFGDIPEAKGRCFNEPDCKGVMDWDCDEKPNFALCSEEQSYKGAYWDCVYDKIGKVTSFQNIPSSILIDFYYLFVILCEVAYISLI